MSRKWWIRLETPNGTLECYIHEDGRWEFDPAFPVMPPGFSTQMLAYWTSVAQWLESGGWTEAEIKAAP